MPHASSLLCKAAYNNTVESHLTNTPQQRAPTIKWTTLKVLTVLSFTSILTQSLNSGHPATLYNGWLSQSQLYAMQQH